MKKTNRLSIDELKAKWNNIEITQNLDLIVGGLAVAAECHIRSNGNGSYTDECSGWTWQMASDK